VQVQGTCQKYVTIRFSTVNLAEDIEPEVISRIYLQAWKKGLKGITITAMEAGIPFSVDGKHTPFQDAKNGSLPAHAADGGDGEKIACMRLPATR
jgi:ribonucleoside-diphosphate reductase alpha chain